MSVVLLVDSPPGRPSKRRTDGVTTEEGRSYGTPLQHDEDHIAKMALHYLLVFDDTMRIEIRKSHPQTLTSLFLNTSCASTLRSKAR